MTTIIVCREVGFDCDAVVREPGVDDALATVAAHVKAVHGIDDVTPEMVTAAIAVMREETGPDAAQA